MNEISTEELRKLMPGKPESFYLRNACKGSPFRPNPPPLPPTPARKLKRPQIERKRTPATAPKEPSESQSQQATVKWWAQYALHREIPQITLMAFPMQGARTARNGARLKAEGMRAGISDMFLALPREDFAGLWIENKTSKGRLTETQIAFQNVMARNGYKVVTCRSSDETKKEIKAYLGDLNP